MIDRNPSLENRFHACDSRGLLALLDVDDERGSLNAPAEVAEAASADFPRIDGYEITGRLGEGGMGVVWRTIQLNTRRHVALKVLSQLSGTNRSLARFEREIELAARLEHPHIARVYERGTRNGLNYYAMELIDGSHLDRHVRQGNLSERQILALIRDVGRAVQFAHQKGVIHRDLKPSNILVSSSGEPHIVDFGLAKAMADELAITVTQEGHFAGTPAFMSPEQARGEIDSVDTRSDVYSLGATLYLLLTGETAHDLSGPRYQAIRRIASEDVRRPRLIKTKLDPELEWVLLKALAPDADKRYSSAGALADDIDRYLNGEPLEASPPSRMYRVRKFALKNRTALSLVTLVAIVLIVGTAVSLRLAMQAARSEAQAVTTLADMYTSRGLEVEPTSNALDALWFAKAASLKGVDADRIEANLIRVNNWLPTLWTPVAAVQGPEYPEALSFNPRTNRYLITLSAPGPADLHCHIWDLAKEKSIPLPAGFEHASAAAWTPDGRLLLGNPQGAIALVSIPEGTIHRRWETQRPIFCLAASNNGQLLAAGAGQALVIAPIDGSADVAIEEVSGDVNSIGFAPDDQRVVLAFGGQHAQLVSILRSENGPATLRAASAVMRHKSEIPDSNYLPIPPKFMSSGRVLVTIDDPGRARTPAILKFRNASTGEEARTVKSPEPLWSMAVSGDGSFLAASAGAGYLFDITGQIDRQVAPGSAGVFNPRRPIFANADNGALIRVENLAGSGNPPFGPPIKSVSLLAMTFSSDGELLAVLGRDGSVRVWKLPAEPPTTPAGATLNYEGKGTWSAFTRDGRFLAPTGFTNAGFSIRRVQVFEAQTAKPAGFSLNLDGVLVSAAFSPDGGRIAVATGFQSDPKRLCIWDWQTGREACPSFELPAEPGWIDYAPDGQAVAVYCHNGLVLLINPENGQRVLEFKANPWVTLGVKNAIRFSRDGKRIYTIGSEIFQAWDRSTGALLYSLTGSGSYVMVTESPDGRVVAAVNSDGNLQLLDALSGHQILPVIVHPNAVARASFSPDGRLIATLCWDSQLRLWDTQTGEKVRELATPERLSAAAFTRDGRNILTVSYHDFTPRGRKALIWDVKSGYPITQPFYANGGYQHEIDTSSDGRWAVIGGSPEIAILLDLNTLTSTAGRTAEDALLWCEILSSMRVEHSETVFLSTTEWFDRWRRYRAMHPEYQPIEDSPRSVELRTQR